MFNFDMFKSINSITVGLTRKVETVTRFFENPFAELAIMAHEVAKTVSSPQPIKWQYIADASTGLKILKSEKDPEALDRVRQIADELFK